MRLKEPTIRADSVSDSASDEIGEAAIFFDFENILLGAGDQFRPQYVFEHLASRGDVLIRRAYADWGRYSRYQSRLLELGVDMVFLPSYGVGDKNRTDTAVCVDAMEVLFTRPNIDTFVIVSGDSDFGVLAKRLRGYGKRVIGISAKDSASKVLASVCHEFIFYESLTGAAPSGDKRSAEKLLHKVLPGLEGYGPTIQPSLLKDRLRKVDPTFSERNYGFSNFLRFCESFPDLFVIEKEGGQTRLSLLTPKNGGAAAPAARRAPPRRPRAGEGRRQPSSADSRTRSDRPAPAERERSRGPRPESAEKPVADVRAPAPRPPETKPSTVRTRETDAAAAKQACKVLLKAVVGAYDGDVALSTVRSQMVKRAPSFDARKLGYKSFSEFLRDHTDVVKVISEGRRQRVSAA